MEDYLAAHPDMKAAWDEAIAGDLPGGWEKSLPVFEPDGKGLATRSASGKVINALADVITTLMGGAADLEPSVNTVMKGHGSFQPDSKAAAPGGTPEGVWGYGGRNISYGVREHAMGAIMNGMAAHGGIIPFGGTFLVFSDYVRPSIRLAALMGLKVIYVFTHDSIGVGEDGPTHQPVEHVMALRAIPGLTVIRPADARETAFAWKAALTSGGPTALILSRQNLATQETTGEGAMKGGYIISDTEGGPDCIIVSTGSEVGLAMKAADILTSDGIKARVVSMPSWELFESQPDSYRQDVLPDSVTARVSVEAGIGMGWERYTGNRAGVVSVDSFGASAPAPEIFNDRGITPEAVAGRVRGLLGR
jgi:transketolase